MAVLRKIGKKLRYGTLIQAILLRLNKLGLRVDAYCVQEEGNFSGDPDFSKNETPTYEIVPLGPDDMREIGAIGGRTEAKLLARLADGKKCFGIKCHGTILAFTWCEFNTTLHDVRFFLKKNEAYFFDTYTVESSRGQNIAPYLCSRCRHILRKLGYSKFYTTRDYFNGPAKKLARKLNSRPILVGMTISILNRWSRTWTIKKYKYADD